MDNADGGKAGGVWWVCMYVCGVGGWVGPHPGVRGRAASVPSWLHSTTGWHATAHPKLPQVARRCARGACPRLAKRSRPSCLSGRRRLASSALRVRLLTSSPSRLLQRHGGPRGDGCGTEVFWADGMGGGVRRATQHGRLPWAAPAWEQVVTSTAASPGWHCRVGQGPCAG